MSQCLKLTPKIKPVEVGPTYIGQITGFDAQSQQWLLDRCFTANKALSLMIEPNVGDKVCFVEVDGQYYINQLLSRADQQAELTITSQQKMHWVAPKMTFTAFEQLEMVSLNKVMMSGKDCVMSAANSMVQHAENLIQQVGQLSVSARGLMKLTGKQQVIIAEKDVRIDGERINMG